jgi:hypothetical protein
MKLRRSLYARPVIVRGQQCAKAPAGRSTVGGPGVQPVRCPARPLSGYLAPSSGRGCPAGWCPAGWCPPGWCPSPSGVQPSVVHPSALSHPSRPASASGSDGGHPVRRGNGHDWIESSSMWSGPVPGGSVDGPMRHKCGHRCGGRVEAGGGASAGGPGPGCASAGGCGRPTRQARPPRGAPVGGDCARAGGWLTRCCRTARCGAAIWPGAATTLRGRCGA